METSYASSYSSGWAMFEGSQQDRGSCFCCAVRSRSAQLLKLTSPMADLSLVQTDLSFPSEPIARETSVYAAILEGNRIYNFDSLSIIT